VSVLDPRTGGSRRGVGVDVNTTILFEKLQVVGIGEVTRTVVRL
jgi:hypothetical protein